MESGRGGIGPNVPQEGPGSVSGIGSVVVGVGVSTGAAGTAVVLGAGAIVSTGEAVVLGAGATVEDDGVVGTGAIAAAGWASIVDGTSAPVFRALVVEDDPQAELTMRAMAARAIGKLRVGFMEDKSKFALRSCRNRQRSGTGNGSDDVQDSMKRSNVNKQMATLVALGVIFTACASDDDRGEGEDSSSVEEASEDGLFGEDGGDAEVDLAREVEEPAQEPADEPAAEEAPAEEAPAEAMEESAMEEEAIESEGAESVDAARVDGDDDFAAEAPPQTADDGLFGEEAPIDEADADEAARFDDNRFEDYGYRQFIATDVDPLSTFALDVDTGSYSIARRWLDEGSLPPRESVRPEEYVNAFDYSYDTPRSGLDVSVDGGPSPFDDDNLLVRVGVQAEVVDAADRGDANLTFVIDTSGSMNRDDRLGLVKTSLSILVDELNDDDTVAIVSYAGGASIVLEPTSVSNRDEILDALDNLNSTGGTNLQAGLALGYDLARTSFDDGGINRVVIASDGVANAGITDPDQLAAMLREDADNGIDLVTVGFGMGNFNDVTMEQLANQGDGFYAYVDTRDEAERLFKDELTSTLLTVAKDSKIQVEFDENVVEEYRLIGFENRGVRDSDFRNDDVDAGELGAAHQVTAIYEIELERGVSLDDNAELGVVSLRWEDPNSGEVIEIDQDIDMRDIEPNWTDTPVDFQLATVVATFAEKLRDNPFADDVDIDNLVSEASRLADELDTDEVDELADLIALAARLS